MFTEMRPPPGLLVLAAALLLPASPARACSVCACGDPQGSSADAIGLGELRTGVETEWLTQRARADGGGHEVLEQETVRIVGSTAPLDRLVLAVQVPLVRKHLSFDGGPEPAPPSTVLALGDVELGGRYVLFRRADFSSQSLQTIAVAFGSSFPTGPTNVQQGGQLVDPHGQPGTGGFGPYAGLQYRFRADPWTLTASAAGRYRTEGAQAYRFGSAFVFGTEAVYAWSRLALGLGLDGRVATQDRQAGVPVDSTGGFVLAASPAVYAELGAGLWLRLRAQVPVATALVGDQRLGPTIAAGLQYQVL